MPAFWSTNLAVTAPLLFIGGAFLTPPVAPAEALVSDVVVAELRGRAATVRSVVRALSSAGPVFIGLLSNAIGFSPKGETITLAADRRSDAVRFSVTDRGSGIPPEEQKRVFDAFFRGRKAVQDQIHGTGLGLHLVKQIVEAHGGTVNVESQPEAGSTFIVRIPATRTEHQDELTPFAG
jgi:light-regulated signal transduction histidine kinase (bacteriophytochrome)